jgi:hypothetical protein
MHGDIIKHPKRKVLVFAISSLSSIGLILGSLIAIILYLVKLLIT